MRRRASHRRKEENLKKNVKKVLTEYPYRDIISLLGV
jgi:hypothetical protein